MPKSSAAAKARRLPSIFLQLSCEVSDDVDQFSFSAARRRAALATPCSPACGRNRVLGSHRVLLLDRSPQPPPSSPAKGSVTGTVSDPKRSAVVPGATITIDQPHHRLHPQRQTLPRAPESSRMSPLDAGIYTITVKAPGFESHHPEGRARQRPREPSPTSPKLTVLAATDTSPSPSIPRTARARNLQRHPRRHHGERDVRGAAHRDGSLRPARPASRHGLRLPHARRAGQ